MLNLLIVLLYLAPTVRYRVEAGGFSFALMEPFAIILIVYLLSSRILSNKRISISADSVTIVLIGFIFWVVMVRPWGEPWQRHFSDIRDWGLPVLTYLVLVSCVQKGWRKYSLLFVWIGLFSAVVGIFQYFTDGFRPFASEGSAAKTGFFLTDVSTALEPSVALAFFEHPNSLAMYLLVSIVIAVGWIEKGGNPLYKSGLLILMVMALLWTFAKAQLLTLILLWFLFWLSRRVSLRLFVASFLCVLGTTIVAFSLAMQVFPAPFGTFRWRVGLWETALETVANFPGVLLIGGGEEIYAANAIWPQPHNVYLNLLLRYGLPSLILILILGTMIARRGFFAYKHGMLRREPILRALWISLIAFFITGLVESTLISIETRMIFLLTLASFVGLMREVLAETNVRRKLAFRPSSIHGREVVL